MSLYSKILVPIDGSATAERGLQEAMALARDLNAGLVLLHAVDIYPSVLEMSSAPAFQETRHLILQAGEKVLEQARRRVAEGGIAVEAVLRETTMQRVADVVAEEATNRRCGLIVMGTHGRRGFNRLALGSDAELVARYAPVPVLLVRQDAPPGSIR
jgi:nucleotide-binding universal stress UspA family protein